VNIDEILNAANKLHADATLELYALDNEDIKTIANLVAAASAMRETLTVVRKTLREASYIGALDAINDSYALIDVTLGTKVSR
jgi:hypothetical protein